MTTAQINTSIKTLQADLSKRLSLSFSKKENYGSVVWSGVYDLTLAVGEGDSRDLHQSGYEQMKEKFPDINDQFDQFIIRYINVSLLHLPKSPSCELTLLSNGLL